MKSVEKESADRVTNHVIIEQCASQQTGGWMNKYEEEQNNHIQE
jgi:hypothetical protein